MGSGGGRGKGKKGEGGEEKEKVAHLNVSGRDLMGFEEHSE